MCDNKMVNAGPIVGMFSAIKKAEDSERMLKYIKEDLKRYVDSLQSRRIPKYSGWFICLADDPESKSGYKFVGFFNPDQCEDDGSDEPEWSVIIPIWDKDSIPEFMGW